MGLTPVTLTARESVLIGPIQDAIVAALQSATPLQGDTFSPALLLAGVQILGMAPQETIDDVILRALDLKSGIVVMPPEIVRNAENVGLGFFAKDIECRLTVIDNPKLNRNGINYAAIVERVLYILQLAQLSIAGGAINPLQPDSVTTREIKAPGYNARELAFRTSAGISIPFPLQIGRVVTSASNSWAQLRDMATCAWSTVFLANGSFTAGDGTTPALQQATRTQGGYLQLLDSGDGAWHPVEWVAGIFTAGAADTTPADGGPATKWRVTAGNGYQAIDLADAASGGQFRTMFLSGGALVAGPLIS